MLGNVANLHLLRDDEWLPSSALQQRVCRVVVDELLSLRIKFQEFAESQLILPGIDAIRLQMSRESVEGILRFLVTLELLANNFRRHLFADAVGDVARVAKSAGDVAVDDLPVEVRDLAAAHGFQEIRVMILVHLPGVATTCSNDSARTTSFGTFGFPKTRSNSSLLS